MTRGSHCTPDEVSSGRSLPTDVLLTYLLRTMPILTLGGSTLFPAPESASTVGSSPLHYTTNLKLTGVTNVRHTGDGRSQTNVRCTHITVEEMTLKQDSPGPLLWTRHGSGHDPCLLLFHPEGDPELRSQSDVRRDSVVHPDWTETLVLLTLRTPISDPCVLLRPRSVRGTRRPDRSRTVPTREW